MKEEYPCIRELMLDLAMMTKIAYETGGKSFIGLKSMITTGLEKLVE